MADYKCAGCGREIHNYTDDWSCRVCGCITAEKVRAPKESATMTAETDLLPLYAELQGHPKLEIIKHYARACVEANLAERDAEVEALRAEVVKLRNLRADAIHECALANFRAERLTQALRSILEYIEEGGYGFEYTCERVARAALNPTAAQENDDA